MRLGLLNAAEVSFKKAKRLSRGAMGSSIEANLDALAEHFEYAASINHDTKTLYPEYDPERKKSITDDYYEGSDNYYADDESKSAYANDYYSEEAYGGGGPEGLTFLAKAIAMAESGDVAASLPLFEKWAKMNPGDEMAQENLGVSAPRANP